MYHYYDEVTGQFEPNVRIHNFSKSEPDLVRITGSVRLNPDDKHYPDKKWVKRSQVLSKVIWNEKFVSENTY